MRGTELNKQIVKLLNEDFRISLTEMSRRTKVPISTLHDRLRKIKPTLTWRVGFKND